MKIFVALYLALSLTLALTGCREDGAVGAGDEESSSIEKEDMIWVEASIENAGSTSNPSLKLAANNLDNAQIVVASCLSGYRYEGNLQGLKLYKGDKGCVAGLTQFRLNGVVFFAPTDVVLMAAGTTQIFSDASRSASVLVSTLSQLSSPVVAQDKVAFRVGYMAKGQASIFTITTVAIEADSKVAVEGPSTALSFTVTRDQGNEPLTVALEYSGDGEDRLKGQAIPTQIDFLPGQKSKVLSWAVPSNDLGEDDARVAFDLSPGPYLVALKSHAEIEIQDDAPRITLTSNYSSSQAIDLNLSVSSDANILAWETLAGPQNLVFTQNQGKTFAAATLDGEYDFRLTAVGFNGKTTTASSHASFDVTPPVLETPALADYLVDGWLSLEDSQSHLALIKPVRATDKSAITFSYALIQSHIDCDKNLTFSALSPKSDDATLVAKLSYKICVKAQDAFAWTSFASTSAFSYQTFVPTAVLGNLPNALSSQVTLAINVSGQGVASQRYALLQSTDTCDNPAAYSDSSTAMQIALDMTAYDGQFVKLCVIGISVGGDSQSFAEASSFKWRVDLSAPPPVAQLNLVSLNERIKISFDVSTSEVLHYVIVRSEDALSDFAPVSGQTYAVGAQKGGMTVIYSGLKAEIFDNRISNINPAYYAIYAYDDTLNYSAAVTGSKEALAPLSFNIAQGFDRALRGGVKKLRSNTTGGYYAFGDFTQFGNSSAINRIARFDATGKLDSSFVTGIINGSVYAIAEDNQGRIYIGGTFTKIGAVTTLHVARLLANGTLDTTFLSAVGPNSTVYALELDEQTPGKERLYIGGSFTAFGTRTVGRFAAVDLAGNLDADFATILGTGFNNTVYSLRTVPLTQTLYVGGGFTGFNAKTGTGATRLIRLNQSNNLNPGVIDPTFAIAAGPNSNVYTIELDGGSVYAGGAFTSVNGSSSYKYLVRFSSLGAIDATFAVTKKFNAAVWSIFIDAASSSIYASGDFTLYGTVAAARMARLALDASGTLNTAFATGIGAGFNATVYGVTLASSGLVAGGAFSNYAGQNLPYFARISLTSFLPISPVANGTMFNAQTNIAAFGRSESEIYLGGLFTHYRGKIVNRLVRVDETGQLDVSYAPALNGGVTSMLYNTADSTLLVAGAFSLVGTATQKRIARLLSNGTLDPAFVGGGKAFDSDVYALAQGNEGKIWVGGKFTTYNALAQNKLARLLPDGNLDSSFTLQGTGFIPTTATINSIVATADGGAIVGGSFTSYNGVAANRIIKLLADGNVDTTFAVGTGLNNIVRHMRLINGLLYVGGDFTSYQAVTQNRMVRIKMDGKIDTTFALGAGFNNSVYSIGYDSNSGLLYPTGTFTSFQGVLLGRIAALRLTGVRDTALVAPVGFSTTGTSVLAGKAGILVTGAFISFESKLNDFVARLSFYGSQN